MILVQNSKAYETKNNPTRITVCKIFRNHETKLEIKIEPKTGLNWKHKNSVCVRAHIYTCIRSSEKESDLEKGWTKEKPRDIQCEYGEGLEWVDQVTETEYGFFRTKLQFWPGKDNKNQSPMPTKWGPDCIFGMGLANEITTSPTITQRSNEGSWRPNYQGSRLRRFNSTNWILRVGKLYRGDCCTEYCASRSKRCRYDYNF